MTFQFQLTGNQRLVNWNTEGLMNSLDSLVVFWYIFILNCWILIRKGEWECKARLLSSTWKGYYFLFVCFILCCKYCCRNPARLPSSYLVFGCQVVVSWEAAGRDLKQYYLFCKCASNQEWVHLWPFFNEPSFLRHEENYEEEREELRCHMLLFSG